MTSKDLHLTTTATSHVILALVMILGITPVSRGYHVVIDTFHYGPYPIEQDAADLSSALRNAGYDVTYHTGPITQTVLASADVWVEFYPVSSVPITTGEASTLRNWVEDGHGLWLGSTYDNRLGAAEQLNLITGAWDMFFETDTYDGRITDISGHVVIRGNGESVVESLDLDLSCSITGGLSLARAPDGASVLAVLEPGNGRVVAVGDSLSGGLFHKGTIYQADNLDLALNSAAYLVPEPATVVLLGFGSLALLRTGRRR